MKYLKLKRTFTAAVLLAGVTMATACLIPSRKVCVRAGTVIGHEILFTACGEIIAPLVAGGTAFAPEVTAIRCGGSTGTVPASISTVMPIYGWTASPFYTCGIYYTLIGYADIICTGTAPAGGSCPPCPALSL